MKLQIVFKDPDAVEIAIDDALSTLKIEGVSSEELHDIKEKRKEELKDLWDK